MNKNVSETVIEIDGTEYTLFLNRAGLLNWEKLTQVAEKAQEYQKKYENIIKGEPIVVDDNTDPFALYEDDDLDDDTNVMLDIYAKFYWIALYTHHKLPLSKATELFEKAREEYGLEQLIQLANQIIEEMNVDKFQKEIKNLKALKPTKQK